MEEGNLSLYTLLFHENFELCIIYSETNKSIKNKLSYLSLAVG